MFRSNDEFDSLFIILHIRNKVTWNAILTEWKNKTEVCLLLWPHSLLYPHQHYATTCRNRRKKTAKEDVGHRFETEQFHQLPRQTPPSFRRNTSCLFKAWQYMAVVGPKLRMSSAQELLFRFFFLGAKCVSMRTSDSLLKYKVRSHAQKWEIKTAKDKDDKVLPSCPSF